MNNKNLKNAEKIKEKIAKEQEKLAELENQQKKIEESIKDCKARITELKNQEVNEKLTAIKDISASKLGVNVDDVLNAVLNGDFYSLQEKIENSGKPKKENISNETVSEKENKTSDFLSEKILDEETE